MFGGDTKKKKNQNNAYNIFNWGVSRSAFFLAIFSAALFCLILFANFSTLTQIQTFDTFLYVIRRYIRTKAIKVKTSRVRWGLKNEHNVKKKKTQQNRVD